ncbi:MAG: cyclase family protein [Alphaproteobacteria bacterium]|nr:cyclase family protein [Alphaproteobacteria bacterium]USO07477.1 MAG: cyclase family protein [Rhodospirillales bacterium]
MKSLVDLTHIFTGDMPVYPGDPCARLYQTMFVEKDGFSDHKVETCMHVGTHIDAPLHMIAGGARICDVPLAHCTGRGRLIDARGLSPVITAECLEGTDLRAGDVVLVYTGWSARFREDDYYKAYPMLDERFAHGLVKAGVAMVGLDTPSPDYDPFPVHKILLAAGILIAENLTNLSALENREFRVHAYPVKYEADAAPARIVAEIG